MALANGTYQIADRGGAIDDGYKVINPDPMIDILNMVTNIDASLENHVIVDLTSAADYVQAVPNNYQLSPSVLDFGTLSWNKKQVVAFGFSALWKVTTTPSGNSSVAVNIFIGANGSSPKPLCKPVITGGAPVTAESILSPITTTTLAGWITTGYDGLKMVQGVTADSTNAISTGLILAGPAAANGGVCFFRSPVDVSFTNVAIKMSTSVSAGSVTVSKRYGWLKIFNAQ